jgi:hypothetical protein
MMHIIFNNRGRLLIALVSWASLAIATCARADEPLRWKFKLGEKLNYNIVQEMTMKFPQAMSSTHQEMEMSWDVQGVNEQGEAVIRQKFNRIKVKTIGPRPLEYDSKSETPPTGYAALLAPVFKAMTENEFEITITARGEVKDIRIPEQVLKEIKNAPNAASMGDLATPDGFQKMISKGAMVLPKDPPKAGETWSTKTESKNPFIGKQFTETTYRYDGSKEINGIRCAVFHPTTKVEFEKNEPAPTADPSKKAAVPPGLQTKIKAQSSDGEVLFNIEGGRLLSRSLKQNLTVEASAAGQSIELNIDQKIDVQVTLVGEKKSDKAKKDATSAEKTK